MQIEHKVVEVTISVETSKELHCRQGLDGRPCGLTRISGVVRRKGSRTRLAFGKLRQGLRSVAQPLLPSPKR